MIRRRETRGARNGRPLGEPVPMPDPRWVLVPGATAPAGYYEADRAYREDQLARIEARIEAAEGLARERLERRAVTLRETIAAHAEA